MHRGTVFGSVDLGTGEEGVAVLLQVACAGQLHQQGFCCSVQQVLGQIRKHKGGQLAESGKAVRIFGKRGAQVEGASGCVKRLLQGRPHCGAVTAGTGHGVHWYLPFSNPVAAQAASSN